MELDYQPQFYIPYGSNKTYSFSASCLNCSNKFYIPYGSNKTTTRQSSLKWTEDFYIPYGSNKTSWKPCRVSTCSSFISHMVQIKQNNIEVKFFLPYFYIPYGSNKTPPIIPKCGFISIFYIPYGSNKTTGKGLI